MNRHLASFFLRAAAFALPFAGAAASHGQSCGSGWIGGHSIQGATLTVRAITHTDPDGDGPQPTQVYFGGPFSGIGPAYANSIVRWTPSTNTWTALGDGMRGEVNEIVIMPNGDVVVLGSGLRVNGTFGFAAARWNGTAWDNMNSLSLGLANVGGISPTGEFFIGGNFSEPRLADQNGVARWTGTAWVGVGTLETGGSVPSNEVKAMMFDTNGDLMVGGFFGSMGLVRARAIARWNGSVWRGFGNGLPATELNGFLRALLPLPNGELLVGGDISQAGGMTASGVASWNGTAWTPRGNTSRIVTGFALLANGDLLRSSSQEAIARLQNNNWVIEPNSPRVDRGVLSVLPDGRAVAADDFGAVMVRTDRTWTPLIATPMQVDQLFPQENGPPLARIRRYQPSGAFTSHIARWEYNQWRDVPNLSGVLFNPVSLRVRDNGKVFAAGGELLVGSTRQRVRVAEFDGTNWSFVPSTQFILSASEIELPNGAVLVKTSENIDTSLWDGSTLTPVGRRIRSHAIFESIARTHNDTIYAEAATVALNCCTAQVVKLVGTDWVEVGLTNPQGTITDFAVADNGDLLVAGNFTSMSGVPASFLARFDGTSWHAIPHPLLAAPSSLRRDPAGGFWLTPPNDGNSVTINNVPRRGIVHWDGQSTWRLVGDDPEFVVLGTSTRLARCENGDILAAGVAIRNGPEQSYAFARFSESASLPRDTTVPQSTQVCAGAPASLSVAATSNSSMTYLWRYNQMPLDTTLIPSAATSTLVLPHVTQAIAGEYDCVVTNACGSITTPPHTLALRPPTDERCIVCDSIDFNGNGLFPEDQDLVDFFAVLGGGTCSAGNVCGDIDFNNDGLFPDDNDIVSFLRTLAGGICR